MPGFIPEITTRVKVEIDLSGIDEALDIIQSDDVLSDIPSLTDELNERRTQLQSLQSPLGEAISKSLKSNQEMIISSKHYITGMMANSVDIFSDGDDYLVGNTAMSVDGFPYPLAIETGRREVFPIEAKMLRWFEGGNFSKPVFAKHSSSVKRDPFVEPSIEDTMYDIDEIVDDIFDAVVR